MAKHWVVNTALKNRTLHRYGYSQHEGIALSSMEVRIAVANGVPNCFSPAAHYVGNFSAGKQPEE